MTFQARFDQHTTEPKVMIFTSVNPKVVGGSLHVLTFETLTNIDQYTAVHLHSLHLQGSFSSTLHLVLTFISTVTHQLIKNIMKGMQYYAKIDIVRIICLSFPNDFSWGFLFSYVCQ